jgi:2-keto-4-pentenoate hydratase/2-oxohepta-3-ene-1,7-dioic acid hydratase in catechol pathway
MIQLLRCSTGVAAASGGHGGNVLPLAHILGIGRNYAEHAKEQGAAVPDAPMVFTKNAMAACLSGEDIVVPRVCQDARYGGDQVDFEGELAVVIGDRARDVSKADALKYVLGYCVANDVSARWWQKTGSGGQFFRGKSFDTFCPLGPGIVPASEVKNPNALRLRTTVNGHIMQDASTSEMVFDVATLVSDLSRGMTLLPGTVILTGTPSGVGMSRKPPVWLKDGDVVEVAVEGVGVISNRVRFER